MYQCLSVFVSVCQCAKVSMWLENFELDLKQVDHICFSPYPVYQNIIFVLQSFLLISRHLTPKSLQGTQNRWGSWQCHCQWPMLWRQYCIFLIAIPFYFVPCSNSGIDYHTVAVKWSLTRDFQLHVFFMNLCPPGPQVFQGGRFEFFRKFVEIFANIYDTSDKLYSGVNNIGENLFYRRCHSSLSLGNNQKA
jgi:hypothetical protein